jgi:hypothetical protein
MMEQLNLMSQQKWNCWDTFTFNNSTAWDNDGTAQPAAPEKQTVGILYFQHLYLYLG